MLPWVGAPSASLGMTASLAVIVFVLGLFLGIRQFGLLGYLKNLMPSLGLPMYLAVIIVPMVWVIEFASLFIKHGILAFGCWPHGCWPHGVAGYPRLGRGYACCQHGYGAVVDCGGDLDPGHDCAELYGVVRGVLAAYVFTLLAAMFIGSSIHHH